MVSKNIMKIWESNGLVQYKATDGARYQDGNIVISFEKEDNWPNKLVLTFWMMMVWSSYWGEINWFKQIWKRITYALQIIFSGEIEMQEEFTIYDEESINSFIEALEEGKKKLKESA